MAYARHIKRGRLTDYAAKANETLDREIKAGRKCAACARPFTGSRPRSDDPSLCRECKSSL